MKTIEVSKQARTLTKLLRQASHENLILRSPEGQEFLLAEIDDFDREIDITRKNGELMRFLDRKARQRKKTALAEVKRRLGIDS